MPNVAEELCDQLDKNNDGEIDFDEFVDGYSLFKKMLNRQWEEYEAKSPGAAGLSPLDSLASDAEADAAVEPEPEPKPELKPDVEPETAPA